MPRNAGPFLVSRRGFVQLSTGAAAAVVCPVRSRCDEPGIGAITWHDVREWGVEGRGWTDTESYYDRLPSKAKDLVRPPVWTLGHYSAGMSARFETDAATLHVRYKLLNPALALTHMPATGASGVDLYGRSDDDSWRWVGVTRPTEQEIEEVIAQELAPGLRPYTLYLPLYNGVERVEIGTPTGVNFKPVPPRTAKPLVFYGTSIMQGACASRPGMAMTAILERRLGIPIINLGFSGNGPMDLELAPLLGEIDAAVYVLDCLPNMSARLVTARAVPFVERLRRARPRTPIVLAEDAVGMHTTLVPARRTHYEANHTALRSAYQTLQNHGITGVTYMDGGDFLGSDGEATVDGVHPSDLGMARYADAYEPVLRKLLKSA